MKQSKHFLLIRSKTNINSKGALIRSRSCTTRKPGKILMAYMPHCGSLLPHNIKVMRVVNDTLYKCPLSSSRYVWAMYLDEWFPAFFKARAPLIIFHLFSYKFFLLTACNGPWVLLQWKNSYWPMSLAALSLFQQERLWLLEHFHSTVWYAAPSLANTDI